MTTLKEITHDSGPPLSNHWTTITDPGGRGSVTVAAALNGSVEGLQIDYDATNDLTLSEPFTSPASNELRLRFYFDSNGVASPTVASSKIIARCELNDDGSLFGTFVSQIVIRKRSDGIIRVSMEAGFDGGTVSLLTFDVTDDSHCYEMAIKRASTDVASDGSVKIYIDEVLRGSDTALDNFDLFPTADNIVFFSEDLEAAMIGAVLYADEFLLTDVETTSLCAAAQNLTIADMTKPASLSVDGSHIYVALLDGGTPIVSKISTALNADGTTVFNPGAGTNIGVECGRFNADVIWIAGSFDGTNTIEKSEDAGSTFTVKDDGTYGGMRTFDIGPDSDDRLIAYDEDNGIILETINSGNTWTDLNSGVGADVDAIARLGENVQESAFGTDDIFLKTVQYSVNSGIDLEDLSLPVNIVTSGLIAN